MKFTTAALKDICRIDRRFQISPLIQIDSLLFSIGKSGVLNPPVLVRRDGKDILLSGWKRIRASEKLGLQRIPVFKYQEPSDLKAFEIPVYENLSIRGYTPVEKTLIIRKFKEFGADQATMIRKYLTLLNLPPKPEILEDCLRISSFDDRIKKTAFKEDFSFPVLQKLMGFEPAERTRLVPVLRGLSKNSRIEVLENIHDIMGRENTGLKEIFQALGIFQILDSQKLSIPQKAENIRKIVRQKRYPALSTRKQKVEAVLSTLGLPENIAVLTPRNFEKEGFSLQMRCRTPEQLEKNIKEINQIARGKGISILFDVLSDD